MVIFCLYEGSESASLDLAQSLTTQSNASTWTLDCKGEAFFLTSELKRYDEQRHDGWTVNNYDDDQEGSSCHLRRVSSLVRDHQASFAQGDRFTGSSTISEIVSEDSLEFIGPHSKSYTVELERLSKQASAFLLPSQGTALRLMPKESVPPRVATYCHPCHPEEFYPLVPRPSRKSGRRVRKFFKKLFHLEK